MNPPTSVSLPKTLKYIEPNVFNKLTIESVCFSNGTKLSNGVFRECTKLKDVILPNDIDIIPDNAFQECTSLSNIVFPESLSKIGNASFTGAGIVSISLPSNVSELGKYCFGSSIFTTYNKTYDQYIEQLGYSYNQAYGKGLYIVSPGKVQSVYIPKDSKLTRIECGAFSGNTSLKSVIILGEKIQDIGDMAFYRAKLDTIVLPENIKTIGDMAFGYTNTKKFHFSKRLRAIGNNSFIGSNITEAILPIGVTTIGYGAFANCNYLEAFTIPSTISHIGHSAFRNDKSLKQCRCYLDVPIEIDEYVFSNSSLSTATLKVKTGAIPDYIFNQRWGLFGDITSLSDDEKEYGQVFVNTIEFDMSSRILTVGGEDTIIVSIQPNDAEDKTLTWSSSNPFVVSVTSEGVINAIAAGVATITATTNDGTNLSASCEVSVIDVLTYIRGDANGDSSIDVADISATASYILGSSPAGFVIEAADVNEDKEIDVADISGIANIILNGSGVKSRAGADGIGVSVADFEIKPGETKEVAINLNNPKDEFTGLQLDLYLPEGISIPKEDGEYKINFGSRTTYKKHSLESALQEDGAIRLLMYSAKNNTFSGESGDVVILTLKADDNLTAGTKTINLKNTVLSRADGSKAEPEDSKCNVTVKSEDPQPSDIAVFVSDFEMLAGETKEVTVNLNNSGDEFTGIQLDLYLPEGISIPKEEDEYKIDFGSRTTYKKHSLESALQEDGAIRLLMYSAKNNTFSGESGDVIILTLKADDNLSAGAKTIDLKNIVLSRADGSKAEPKDSKATVTISVFDDIETIDVTAESNISIYTITGTKLSTPQKGINIIGGKKVFVK